MTTTETPTEFAVDLGPVGREHQAQKQHNGNYAVVGIPVFQETERGGKKFDKEFLTNCVKFHQKKQNVENHAPSVHLGHNREGEEKPKIGELHNLRMGTLNNKPTIFADVVDIKPKDFDQIKDGKLPHVSVELSREYPFRISSLAFLSSSGPFFTLPNIRIKDSFETAEALCFETSENIELIWKFQDEDEEEEEVEEDAEAQEKAQEEEGGETGAGSIEERVANLESKMDKIIGKLEDIEMGDDRGTGSPIAQPEKDSEKSEDEGEEDMSGKTENFEELKDEVEKVKKQNKELRKQMAKSRKQQFKAKVDAEVEKAINFAEEQGKRFDEDTKRQDWRDYILKMADNCKDFKTAMELSQKYINDQIKEMRNFDGLGGHRNFVSTQPFSDVVSKFSDESEDIRQIADQADKQFKQDPVYFQEQGWTQDDWVQTQVQMYKEGWTQTDE